MFVCILYLLSVQYTFPSGAYFFYEHKERILRPLFCNFLNLFPIEETNLFFLLIYLFYPDHTSEGHIYTFVSSTGNKTLIYQTYYRIIMFAKICLEVL